MNTPNLEARIQRLEDLEAIKNTTARYSFYINKGWNGKEVNAEAMVSVFSKNATWECKDMNICVRGLKEIMLDLPESTRNVEFSMHIFNNPLIEINGYTAVGNWLFWVASRHKGGVPNEVFMSADITYVCTGNGWLIQTFKLYSGMALQVQK